MTDCDLGRRQRIALLNDQLRHRMPVAHCFMTQGVEALPIRLKRAAIERVRTFDAFGEDNDPHGEHDFGNFELESIKFFWKIDYYDHSLQGSSPDPTDPKVTRRILTIMIANEY
ncbi:MAG: hypothetical protein Alpg2KO_31260 [Alphaproteobacteria bacterium]